MKLLYITNGITGIGGLERVLSIKASYFAEELGYEVHIVSLGEEGKTPFYAFSPRITFHSIDVSVRRSRYFTGSRRLVRRLGPDVISVCDDGLKGFFVPLWIGGRSRIIYERHTSKEMQTLGGRPGLRQRVALAMMDMGSRLFDRFVVLTNENRRQWRGKNVEVIPNPLSFYPASVSGVDEKRIIAVGKVTPSKGYDRLVGAWRLIGPRYPEWRIDIFGSVDGGGVPEGMGGGMNIRIHEPVREIEKEYLASSIYALPSRFEGFGMVLTEAMACGVPCVAFDCPCGPRDIIRDGEDGFLVENGNVGQFAERLSRLIDDAGLRRTMGEKARANARRYDIAAIAAQWDKLFSEL